MNADDAYRCGLAAVIGRPNVGKSSLLNAIIGQKLSITSARPQTTRYAIRAICNRPAAQIVFVDTPGYQTRHRSGLNRSLQRGIASALRDIDAAVWVVEAGIVGERDRSVLSGLGPAVPIVVAINKIDRLDRKEALLPFIGKVSGIRDFAAVVPVCALRGEGVEDLVKSVDQLMPYRPAMYPTDDLSDRGERFFAAEFLREQLFRRLGDELPYGLAVEIERFEQEGNLRRIAAVIIVEREAHKAMVIGKAGGVLKAAGADARRDMEDLFGGPVFLETWVKVKRGWVDDERMLKALGLE